MLVNVNLTVINNLIFISRNGNEFLEAIYKQLIDYSLVA